MEPWELADDLLLHDCDWHATRASGPGGQKRNKTHSAIQIIHRPTGVMAHANESRLQGENRAVALPHRRERGLERYPVFDQLYTLDELIDELEGADLRVVAMEGLMRHARTQRRINRLRRLGPTWGLRLLLTAVESVPSRRPSTWMVVCERRR